MNNQGILRLVLTFVSVSAGGVHAEQPQAESATNSAPIIRSFVADRTAHAVGDMLTILIVESAQVSQSAKTQAGKSDSVAASARVDAGSPEGLEADLSTAFEGAGTIERSGRLLARLAVTVESVDAQGNLLVAGKQDIHINNESQEIRLSGRVRPEDIYSDNTILSWRVSDAEIELVGKGFLSQKQSPGLVARLLNFFRL